MKLCSNAISVALAIVAAPALACGYCVEDKVAAAYDHRVVERAFGQRHEVLFLSLEFARPVPGDAAVSIRRAVESIAGVDRGTVRIAVEAGALSLAYDPRRVQAAGILRTLGRDLAQLGVSFALLQLDGPDRLASGSAPAAPTPVSSARLR